MVPKKTLRQREKELQSVLATPGGQGELKDLGSRYCTAGGRARPERASVITYILVYEGARHDLRVTDRGNLEDHEIAGRRQSTWDRNKEPG